MTFPFYIQKDVTAFEEQTIGSKVIDKTRFFIHLEAALDEYDSSKDRAPGQHFVTLSKDSYSLVSAGDGVRTKNPDDYIIRSYREGPKMFLKREFAGDVNFLAVVVYTREAFLADPDITKEEGKAIGNNPYAIVAVIASSGPKGTLSPYRFVHNLAGGNNEYITPERLIDLKNHCDWLVTTAKYIKKYTDKYITVAD